MARMDTMAWLAVVIFALVDWNVIAILMIGFAANFMGSAMRLGDLPPQMLHSVAGAAFMDFFWQRGRPSSFPILILTFAITLAAMYAYGFRGRGAAGRRDTGGAGAR
jgi:Na+/H+ antiporter NhaD/arsenite permease-like protein